MTHPLHTTEGGQRKPRKEVRPSTIGAGCAYRQYRRIVVDVDPETFAEIRGRATAESRSVSATIRDLLEWGLMAHKEAE